MVTEWPPYSPDLNPIEHVWFRLKTNLEKAHPTSQDKQYTIEEVRILMENVLPEAWSQIDKNYIDSLIDSMPRRCRAVVNAKGWYTKY